MRFLLSMLAVACATVPAIAATDLDIVRAAPPVDGYRYRCEEMVNSVNALRRIGKERALGAMREYASNPANPGTDRVTLICRLLFVPTNGAVPHLTLGEPVPELDWDVAKSFPSFPIVLHKGVPFLVVQGYRLGGFQNLQGILTEYEKYPIRTNDLQIADPFKAARSLGEDERWQRLYTVRSDEADLKALLLHQARPSNTVRADDAVEAVPRQ